MSLQGADAGLDNVIEENGLAYAGLTPHHDCFAPAIEGGGEHSIKRE
ncbi:MAG: hypothetical protein Q8K63_04460 [Acidimicrobiales bacterium]|nr:hypothetical protein [Acidimicrobiales bacterium]